MNLNINDSGHIVQYLQGFLRSEYNSNVIVSGVLDEQTIENLQSYLLYPEVASLTEVEDILWNIKLPNGDYLHKHMVFNCIIDRLEGKSKATLTKEEDKRQLDTALFDAKMEFCKVAWNFDYWFSYDNRFYFQALPQSSKNVIPRNDLLPTFNLASTSFVDNYKINVDTSELDFVPAGLDGFVELILHDGRDKTNEFAGWKTQERKETGLKYFTIRDGLSIKKYKYPFTAEETAQLEDYKITVANLKIGDYFYIQNIRTKHRTYIINNITPGKYVIAHSNGSDMNIQYAVGSKYVHESWIRANIGVDMTDAKEIIVQAGEYCVIDIPKKLNNGNTPRTLFISYQVPPTNPNEDFYLKKTSILGDINGDGVVNGVDEVLLEMKFKEVEGTLGPADINKYTDDELIRSQCYYNEDSPKCDVQEIKDMDSVDFTSMQFETYDWIKCHIQEPEVYPLRYITYKQKQNIPEISLYCVKVPNYFCDKRKNETDTQIDERIKETFKNVKFNESPFIIHSKFIDYLLDMCVNTCSNTEQVKQIEELVYSDSKGLDHIYTNELRDKIIELQKRKNIAFTSGFVDVETRHYLEGGE